MNTIDIIIADDHPFIRMGIGDILASENWINCVGEAENSDEVIRFCREIHPNILLMNLHIPNLAPVEIIKKVRNQSPGIKTIVISAGIDDTCSVELIAQEISGFLLEDEIPKNLVPAIRAVSEGNTWFSQEVFRKLINPSMKPVESDLRMTERELKVIQLVAQGQTNAQIACQLNVSKRTVDHCIETLFNKLRAQNRVQMVRLAIEKRILPVKRMS